MGVQQTGLEYRPLPVDLTPDAWRILEFWRALSGGNAGSTGQAFEQLEVYLAKTGDRGEDYADAAPHNDLFGSMALAHGSFHTLREALARSKSDEERRRYYFAAERPDSLKNLLARLNQSLQDSCEIDPVETWIMLRWIQQLCRDNRDLSEARSLEKQAGRLVQDREQRPPLSSAGKEWLDWTASMFLCPPGKEQSMANRLLRKAKQ